MGTQSEETKEAFRGRDVHPAQETYRREVADGTGYIANGKGHGSKVTKDIERQDGHKRQRKIFWHVKEMVASLQYRLPKKG